MLAIAVGVGGLGFVSPKEAEGGSAAATVIGPTLAVFAVIALAPYLLRGRKLPILVVISAGLAYACSGFMTKFVADAFSEQHIVTGLAWLGGTVAGRDHRPGQRDDRAAEALGDQRLPRGAGDPDRAGRAVRARCSPASSGAPIRSSWPCWASRWWCSPRAPRCWPAPERWPRWWTPTTDEGYFRIAWATCTRARLARRAGSSSEPPDLGERGEGDPAHHQQADDDHHRERQPARRRRARPGRRRSGPRAESTARRSGWRDSSSTWKRASRKAPHSRKPMQAAMPATGIDSSVLR